MEERDSNAKNKLRNYLKNSNLGGKKGSTIILSNPAFLTGNQAQNSYSSEYNTDFYRMCKTPFKMEII